MKLKSLKPSWLKILLRNVVAFETFNQDGFKLFNFIIMFYVIHQIRDPVFFYISKTKKTVENTTHSGVFLKNFEVRFLSRFVLISQETRLKLRCWRKNCLNRKVI